MIKLLLMALLAVSCTAVSGKTTTAPAVDNRTVLEVASDRLVSVVGVVNAKIIDQANDLVKLADESTDDIFVHINSPGGSVRAGNVFIQAIKLAQSRGIQVKCATSSLAASMAFVILTHCSERYALKGAELMFHPVRVMLMFAALSANDLEMIWTNLYSIDHKFMTHLANTSGIPAAVITKAYYQEKFWEAKELRAVANPGWLTLVDDLQGVDAVFARKPTGDKGQIQNYEKEFKSHGHVYVQ